MKSILFLAVAGLAAAASDPAKLIERMDDKSLTSAQRANACYELRGVATPEVIAAMERTLANPQLRGCAGTNLRKAGAAGVLATALTDDDYEIRALAAREIGSFEKAEYLPALVHAAHDSQLIVAMNAIEGLCNYRDKAVVMPALLEIAKDGGMGGTAALSRAQLLGDPRVLTIARKLLDSLDVSDKLTAMRVLADLGDPSDLAKLHEIKDKEANMVATTGRGFGFMPAISLSRAAATTIAKIEERAAKKG
jgi:HEAT repeat protein